MGKEIIRFGNIEVEKSHQCKSPISINDVDISKIVVTNWVPFGKKRFKYFGYIGYKDGKKVRPLHVMLPKLSVYRRDFDETKYVFFDKK